MYKVYEVTLPTNCFGFSLRQVEELSGDHTFIPDWMFHFGTKRDVPDFISEEVFAEWLLGGEVISNHEVADEMWGAL